MSKQYTRSEVASLNCKDKTLIIIHDNVYDVTTFLNEHPGGEEILLDHGGKDASEDFDDVGHSKDALDLMKTYKVGELVEAEKNGSTPKQTWPSGYSKDGQNKQDQGISPMLWKTPRRMIAATQARDPFDRQEERDSREERGPPEDELEDPHAWTIDRELKRQRVRRTVMRP